MFLGEVHSFKVCDRWWEGLWVAWVRVSGTGIGVKSRRAGVFMLWASAA